MTNLKGRKGTSTHKGLVEEGNDKKAFINGAYL